MPIPQFFWLLQSATISNEICMFKAKHLIVYAADVITKKPFRWMIIILE